MSVKVTSWVFEYSRSKGNDRLVLLAIADRADDEGRDAYPAMRTIAKKANCHIRTAKDCITNLERSGELVIKRGAGRNGTNLYQVRMDVLPFGQVTRKRPRGRREPAPPGGWSRHHRGGWSRHHPIRPVRPYIHVR